MEGTCIRTVLAAPKTIESTAPIDCREPALARARTEEKTIVESHFLPRGPCALFPMHRLARQAKDVVIGGEEHQAADINPELLRPL
jgi:hypothetical protein